MPKTILDKTDYKILHYLQNNARITNIDLAELVDLSPSPCLRRVKALEESGVITRYAALVDEKSVGMPISVFVNVTLQHQERQRLEEFELKINSFSEVMVCYLMTGTYDYLLRIVVPDLESYERFLAEKLTRIPGVANIQSSFALKQVVYKTELPLERSSVS